MSDTPRTDEAIERWHQGKVNILEELSKLETDLNWAEAERVELAKQLQSEKEMYAACQNECEEQARLLGMSGEREATLLANTGFWESLIGWLERVQEGYKGQDRDGLCQLYVRGPFAGWSQEEMVRLADELWENSQKHPFHPKETQHLPYPEWICNLCGNAYGHGMPKGHIATWHLGECDICRERTEVTEPRDFRHLRKWPLNK